MNVTKCKRWHSKYWVLPLIGKISPLLQTVSWSNLHSQGGNEQVSRCQNLFNQRDRINRRKAVRILNHSRSMTCLSGWRHLTRRRQQCPSLQVTQLRRLSSLTPANWQSLIGSLRLYSLGSSWSVPLRSNPKGEFRPSSLFPMSTRHRPSDRSKWALLKSSSICQWGHQTPVWKAFRFSHRRGKM